MDSPPSASAISVPTGLQDYRPALYGGIAALELEVNGVRRVPLQVDLKELQRRNWFRGPDETRIID